jgi:hypothetical protein
MRKSNKIVISLIISFLLTAVFGQDDSRPSSTWQVQKYDISVTLPQNEADRAIAVKAKLDVKNVSARPASTLTLRIGSGAEITAVRVGDAAVEPSRSEEKISASASLQRIVLRMPSVQPNGTVSATVDYKFTVKDNTGVNAIAPTGVQFLPTSFWYPTPNSWFFARGADFAPFRIQVQGGGRSVVSSGVETAGTFDQKLTGPNGPAVLFDWQLGHDQRRRRHSLGAEGIRC